MAIIWTGMDDGRLRCGALLFVLLSTPYCARPALARTDSDCLELRKVSTSYDALRLGNSFGLHLKFHGSHCYLPAIRGADPNPPGIWLRVKNSPEIKFQYRGFGFGSLEQVNPGQLPAVEGSRELNLYFEVTALPGLPGGEHQLSALLGYETVDATGVRTPQKLAMVIPLKVVPADAQVTQLIDKGGWNPANVLLIPVRLLIEIGHVIAGPNLSGW